MLRAYVDEPDLGRIKKGQPIQVQWDGLPNRRWQGAIEKTAEQVVALNNRAVGLVLCSVDGDPKELIPNLNIKVEITTDMKADALVVPKSAVISQNGRPTVLLYARDHTVAKPVEVGLVTSEEIEILHGVSAGDAVVLNPNESGTNP